MSYPVEKETVRVKMVGSWSGGGHRGTTCPHMGLGPRWGLTYSREGHLKCVLSAVLKCVTWKRTVQDATSSSYHHDILKLTKSRVTGLP